MLATPLPNGSGTVADLVVGRVVVRHYHRACLRGTVQVTVAPDPAHPREKLVELRFCRNNGTEEVEFAVDGEAATLVINWRRL